MKLEKRTFLYLMLGALCFGLLSPFVASADTIFQSQVYSTQSVPFTQSVSYARFNPALGTLLAVQIGGTTNVTAEVDVFNNTATNQSFTNAQASVPIDISTNYGLIASFTTTAGPFSGIVTPGLNAFTGLSSSYVLPPTNISPVNFSDFIQGPSSTTVSLNASSTGGVFNGNSSALGRVFFGGSAVAGGTLTLTYIYTSVSTSPTPLPGIASAGLCLFGMLGMAKARKHV